MIRKCGKRARGVDSTANTPVACEQAGGTQKGSTISSGSCCMTLEIVRASEGSRLGKPTESMEMAATLFLAATIRDPGEFGAMPQVKSDDSTKNPKRNKRHPH